MSKETIINSQAVKPTEKVQESRPKEQPEKIPSVAAKAISSADGAARVTDYKQFVTSNDYRTVETGENERVTIINSANLKDASDPERDQKYAVSVATASQYRKFEHGGLTRQKNDALSKGNVKSADNAAEGDAAFKMGLMRGQFTV